MAISEPLFMLPIVIPAGSGPHITLTRTDGTVDVTLTAGTYYNHGDGAGTLLKEVEDQIAAADISGANWAVAHVAAVAGSGVWGRTSIYHIDADPGKEPLSLTFLTDYVTSRHLGFTTAPGDPDTVNLAADDTTLTSDYQRSHIWLPDDFVLADDRVPKKTIVGQIAINGTPYLVSYGGHYARVVQVGYVKAARTFIKHVNRSDFASLIDATTGDLNLTLEQFMADMLDGIDTNDTPPLIRFAVDIDTPATYDELYWMDLAALRSLDTALGEMGKSPLQYRLTFRGIETG